MCSVFVKKVLLLATLLIVTTSCQNRFSQVVTFHPRVYFRAIDAQSKNGVKVVVTDQRLNQSFIGRRGGIWGGVISGYQDLKQIFQNELSTAIRKDGFPTGSDRIVYVNILSLTYNTKWGLLSTASVIKCEAEVVIKDNHGAKKHGELYSAILEIDHYGGYPLASTNENNINRTIASLLQQILDDGNFLEGLRGLKLSR